MIGCWSVPSAELGCGEAACIYYYTGIGGGNAVSDLTSSSKFPHSPDETVGLTSGNFEAPANYGDNYGAMLEGFVKAPSSGQFIFFTNSDDSSEVWVATQPNVRDTAMVKVVELVGCCREVAGAVHVAWEEGKIYHIKAYMKEGGGGDYLKVGMQQVGGTKFMPIPISMRGEA